VPGAGPRRRGPTSSRGVVLSCRGLTQRTYRRIGSTIPLRPLALRPGPCGLSCLRCRRQS
jgi:hypothetical protein